MCQHSSRAQHLQLHLHKTSVFPKNDAQASSTLAPTPACADPPGASARTKDGLLSPSTHPTSTNTTHNRVVRASGRVHNSPPGFRPLEENQGPKGANPALRATQLASPEDQERTLTHAVRRQQEHYAHPLAVPSDVSSSSGRGAARWQRHRRDNHSAYHKRSSSSS